MRLLLSFKIMAVSIAVFSPSAWGNAPTDRVKLLLSYKQSVSLFATPETDLKAALDRRAKYTEITDDQAKRILTIGGKIYKPANLFDVFSAAYAAFAKPKNVEAEIAMFESKVGLMYQAALAEMATPDFQSRVDRYWQSREITQIEQNRKNVISSYIKQTKIAETQGVFHAGMDIGIDLSLNAFKRRNYRQTLETIKRQTRLRKNNYIMDNADRLIQGVTFAFRELKNTQIDWITRFYFSRFGEQSTQAYMGAMEITMDRAGETLMHNLNADTKKPPTPRPSVAQPQKKKGDGPKEKTNTKEVVKTPKKAKGGPPASKLNLSPKAGATIPANDTIQP